ncbi:MAG: DUF3576 domain-containing protein [Alphaproteobacteria bacterium]
MKRSRDKGRRGLGAVSWMALTAALIVAGCGGMERESEYPTSDSSRGPGGIYKGKEPDPGSLFGPGGLNIFGGDEKKRDGGGGIGVNSFLWRASLDTFSFMPLNSADPFGGVIITDWHSPPETPNQRFKLTVYILTRDLRADGIRVAVFRQVKDAKDEWRDASVEATTVTQLENAVLTRARELRIASSAE